MIIQYDTRPDATIDEKLRSLIESVQLALNGIGEQNYAYQTSQDKSTDAVLAAIRQIEEAFGTLTSAIGGLSDRLDILELKTPAAPTTDGAYKLTVTVTDGEPVYTWEAV